MGTQQVVERILSDAAAEVQATVEKAETQAAKILADASACAEAGRRQTEADVKAQRESILEKRAAAARLDSAKLTLGEKRKVIDSVYKMALGRLQSLGKEDALKLVGTLLEKYAESGDEIFFAENFAYKTEAAALPIIKAKNLRIAAESLPLDGGMRLKGEKSDKDLSYGALLEADREENQADLARELFK